MLPVRLFGWPAIFCLPPPSSARLSALPYYEPLNHVSKSHPIQSGQPHSIYAPISRSSPTVDRPWWAPIINEIMLDVLR